MRLSGLARPMCPVRSIGVLLLVPFLILMSFMLMGIIVGMAKQYREFCCIGCRCLMHMDTHIIVPASPNLMADSLHKQMIVRDARWRTIPFHSDEIGEGGGEAVVLGP